MALEAIEQEQGEDQETGEQEEGAEGTEEQVATEEQPRTDGEPPRPPRRERKAERGGLIKERDELRARTASLEAQIAKMVAGQQQTTESVRGLTETIARQLPQEKSRVETLQDQMDDILPRVGDDPSAYRQYKALQVELMRSVAEDAATQRIDKFRQEQPAPPSQAEAELVRQYAWVETNLAAREAVNSTIKHLARDGRDMRDPDIRESTFLEAGAMIASAYKLPSRGSRGGDSNQRDRFSSGSGRGGAAGGGSAASYVMTDENWQMARLAYPNLPAKEQEKRFRATLERQMKSRA